MTLKEHPRSNEFADWIAKQAPLAIPLSGEFFRAAGPRRTSAKDIVSGLGAWYAGGRWNPIETMKVVYLSEQPETALREANETLRYHNLPLSRGTPRIVVALQVDLEIVLDLTAGQVANELPDAMTTLLAEDWRAIMARGEESTTQALGRAAFRAGIQALRVPSKPDPTGINVLVFPELLKKKNQLQVVNVDALDKLGR